MKLQKRNIKFLSILASFKMTGLHLKNILGKLIDDLPTKRTVKFKFSRYYSAKGSAGGVPNLR